MVKNIAEENYVGCIIYRMVNKIKIDLFFNINFSLLAEIRMTHLDRSYFVTMGTYQMAVLLQFNDHEKLTLNEIEESTKLNLKELEKQIISLIEAKFLLGNPVCLIIKRKNFYLLEISFRVIYHQIQVFQLILNIKVNERNLKFR